MYKVKKGHFQKYHNLGTQFFISVTVNLISSDTTIIFPRKISINGLNNNKIN